MSDYNDLVSVGEAADALRARGTARDVQLAVQLDAHVEQVKQERVALVEMELRLAAAESDLEWKRALLNVFDGDDA